MAWRDRKHSLLGCWASSIAVTMYGIRVGVLMFRECSHSLASLSRRMHFVVDTVQGLAYHQDVAMAQPTTRSFEQFSQGGSPVGSRLPLSAIYLQLGHERTNRPGKETRTGS